MRWKVHGRRTMYESDWVNVYLDDVELPDGTHIDHHVLTMPKASQTAVVLNDRQDQILLIWRHRFITDSWGWEVPAGWVEKEEDPDAAIRREIWEETGYQVDSLQVLAQYDAIPGISTMRFTCWVSVGGQKTSEPSPEETSRVKWHGFARALELLRTGEIHDGPSFAALSYFLSTRRAGVNNSPEALS